MAAGTATGVVEVEFTAGVWTNLSADVDWNAGVRVTQGRSTAFGQWQAATLALTLHNPPVDVGGGVLAAKYTPDNPVSPYWPNVVEGKRIRYRVTGHSITQEARFTGKIDEWGPQPTVAPGDARTTVTATDLSGVLGTFEYRAEPTEHAVYVGDVLNQDIDIWPLNEEPKVLTATNVGVGGSNHDATIFLPSPRAGGFIFEAGPADLAVDGTVRFAPNSAKVGPTMQCRRDTVGSDYASVQFMFATEEVPKTSERSTILSGYYVDNTAYWALVIRNYGTTTDPDVRLDYDRFNGTPTTVTISDVGQTVNDGQWYWLELWATAEDDGFAVWDETGKVTSCAGCYLMKTQTLVFGGRANPATPDKPILCAKVAIAMPQRSNAIGWPRRDRAVPGVASDTEAQRYVDLVHYVTNVTDLDLYAASGVSERSVARTDIRGRTPSDVLAELALTTGGVIYAGYDGWMRYDLASILRSTTVALTVTAGADDAPGLTLARSVATAPTRVTATSPGGTAIAIDAAAEAAGQRRNEDITVQSLTKGDAAVAASAYLTQSNTLRVSRIVVDAVTASTDLYAALCALRPTSRIRLTGLPTSLLGYSYRDLYLQGWSENWDPDSALWEIDTTPADAPAEGLVGNDEYGRAGGDALFLAAALTSSGTSIPLGLGSAEPGFATAAGEYPLDVDVAGERITITSAPGAVTAVARTNLVTNPSFEAASFLTGWTQSGSGATESQDEAVSGLDSALKPCTTSGAGTDYLQYAQSGLTIGLRYTFSVHVFVPSGSPDIEVVEATGSGTTPSSVRQSTAGVVDQWVRIDRSLTASATSHSWRVRTAGAATVGQSFYVDGALSELSSSVLPYFDGSVAGGTWTGTAHASTSTQAGQTLTASARGVAPSVARAHSIGEPVDVYHAATAAF